MLRVFDLKWLQIPDSTPTLAATTIVTNSTTNSSSSAMVGHANTVSVTITAGIITNVAATNTACTTPATNVGIQPGTIAGATPSEY